MAGVRDSQLQRRGLRREVVVIAPRFDGATPRFSLPSCSVPRHPKGPSFDSAKMKASQKTDNVILFVDTTRMYVIFHLCQPTELILEE